MTPEAWFDIEDGEAWLGGAPVLQSLSLQLRLGESTTVLGPNGAGKSSLVTVSYTHLTLPTICSV